MGQMNIKDDALIADAKALADLLGTSATDAIRQSVHERLNRERRERSEAKQRRFDAIMGAANALREASDGGIMSNAEADAFLYDPETGLPR